MRRASTWIAVALFGCLVTSLTACGSSESGEEPRASVEASAAMDAPNVRSLEVTMMGRSMTQGWLTSWGWNGQDAVDFHGFEMVYREVASPPDIGSDAASKIAQMPEGSVVFFKLCFVDFWAGSSADVDANTRECLGYVREVAEAADRAGATLVVGNALPKVPSETKPSLVQTHLEYNAGLEDLAREFGNVVVLDQYSLLATADGSLAPGLAIADDDSHLSDAAYALLDVRLLEILESLR